MTGLKHNRKLNRKRGYDYSTSGAYFVTVSVHDRQHLFGEIVDGNMILNDAGNMIKTVWDEIPYYYAGIDIDEFIVMPDHIHGIIIVGITSVNNAAVITPPRGCHTITDIADGQADITSGQARGPVPTGSSPAGAIILSLPDIMHRYKTMTTKRYTDGVKQNGWPGYYGKLWQRSYHDRIIRNEDELNRIRQYIINNPSNYPVGSDPVGTGPRACPDNIDNTNIIAADIIHYPEKIDDTKFIGQASANWQAQEPACTGANADKNSMQLESSLPSIEDIEAELEGLK